MLNKFQQRNITIHIFSHTRIKLKVLIPSFMACKCFLIFGTDSAVWASEIDSWQWSFTPENCTELCTLLVKIYLALSCNSGILYLLYSLAGYRSLKNLPYLFFYLLHSALHMIKVQQMFDLDLIRVFKNWSIISFRYVTQWFDICIYCEMIHNL